MAATAATTVTVASQLDGLFKEIYADRLLNLIPEWAILKKMIPFSARDSEGNKYNQPVIVTNEHGWTRAAAAAGAFDLHSPVAMTTQNAEVNGSQFLLRSAMDYETAFRASNSKKAFVKSTELLVENMLESAAKMLECDMLYGGIGIAKTEDAYELSDDSTLELQITDATWAPGIWAGMEDAYINFYSSGTIQGTAGTGTSLGTADMKIESVDYENKRIMISGDSTVLSTIDTAATTSGTTLDIFWKNAYGKEMYGLDYILTNTGTLFGINAATYSMWKANTKAISGQLTLAAFLKALSTPQGRGLMQDAVCLVGSEAWGDLAQQVSALQRFDSSYKVEKGKYGLKAICIYSLNGEIEIIAHPMVKTADVFVFPPKKMKRLGATDITFQNPAIGNKFFRELTDKAGFEFRVYWAQALFCEKPAQTLKMTGITVS